MHPPTLVLDAVADRLDRFVSRMRAESDAHGAEAALFLTAASDTLHGGKRLRARFCHSGWTAVARAEQPAAAETATLWDLCAALEVFQSAALVHDDIIDNSDTRRGRPAAHRALESRHREASWTGRAEEFGRGAALLLGDLLVAWSDDLLEQALADAPHARAVRAEYARMRRDVTLGQFLDIAEESAWQVSPDDQHAERALRVITLKSARYSVEQPLVLGGALAGAEAEQLQALRRFGHPLGLAFQLRDDVLGVFGDEGLTGKPAGDDLREGKRTVLVALARERMDAAARRHLDSRLGDRDLDAAQVAEVQRAIVACGALERVEHLIADYAAEADDALDAARLDPGAVSELRALARAATQRSA